MILGIFILSHNYDCQGVVSYIVRLINLALINQQGYWRSFGELTIDNREVGKIM